MSQLNVLPPGLPGQVLPCLVIDECRVVINPSLNQMEAFVVDPVATEDPKRVAADFRVREAYEMRKRVQRLLSGNKAKRDNVPAYAKYLIDGMVNGKDYVTPPQSLVFTSKLQVYVASDAPGAATYLHVPPGVRGTHDDGETQYLARLMARNQHPTTGDIPMAVIVDHSRTIDWGGQAFHDLNLLGVSMSAAVAIAADGRDPATRIAKNMADVIPELAGKVSFDSRQVSAKGDAIMTITTLRRATVASLVGRKVFALGNKPLTDEITEQDKHDIPLVWRQVFSRLEKHLNHDTVVGLPAVLTAIGIAVHEARAKAGGLDSLLRSLDTVLWDKSTEAGADRWAGIAGKLTEAKDGTKKFSAVGGVKDLGYRVLESLTNPESDDFTRIRTV
jgi:hypothetical protein